MNGMWYDRAIEYEVHRQAERKAARNDTPVESVKRGDFMTPYEAKLAPLPCWKNLPRAEIRKRVAQMVVETEAAAAQLREGLGTQMVCAYCTDSHVFTMVATSPNQSQLWLPGRPSPLGSDPALSRLSAFSCPLLIQDGRITRWYRSFSLTTRQPQGG